jgi:hypothetical protein
MMAQREAVAAFPPMALRTVALLAAAVIAALPAVAQPVSNEQRSTAEQVASAGVPLSELAPNAPDSYTVKSGDTLWAISRMYLLSPWRWPELWGMNMQEVRNPHRIYPGQRLVLEKIGDRARLRLAEGATPLETIRVSPRVRVQSLPDASLPTLQPHLIEPFLAEPVIVDGGVLEKAPRIVAAPDNRVLITRGDRIYARGSQGGTLADRASGPSEEFRVFRSAVPLRDPVTKAVLGYEAQYLGKAVLVRGEGTETVRTRDGEGRATPVPATLDVVSARSEMRVGDRLLPEPGRQLVSYTPRAPQGPVDGAIVSMYGDAVALAGQNQVVVINKGTADGLEAGHVLVIEKAGASIVDKSEPGERTQVKLPNERNGLMMVFRPFERLSYALILETGEGVKVGDRVISPR